MTEEKKKTTPKKKTTLKSEVKKEGNYIVTSENSKTGKASVGNLTKDEAIKTANEIRKDLHNVDVCVLKERTRKTKTKFVPVEAAT